MSIEQGTFSNLSLLSTLIISYNKLQCLEEEAFFGLDSLRILSLHGNDLSRLPESAFRSLHNITHMYLHLQLVDHPLPEHSGATRCSVIAKWPGSANGSKLDLSNRESLAARPHHNCATSCCSPPPTISSGIDLFSFFSRILLDARAKWIEQFKPNVTFVSLVHVRTAAHVCVARRVRLLAPVPSDFMASVASTRLMLASAIHA